MTDNVSDTLPGTLHDGTPEDPDAGFSDSVEDGIALHIVTPHDPGTIFVAVAEPAIPDGDDRPCLDAPLLASPDADGGNGPDDAAPEDFGVPPDSFLPDYGNLAEVAAVRIGGLGPAFFFATNGMPCNPGDKVIVAMEEGHAFGEVVSCLRADPVHLAGLGGDEGGIRPLVRPATDKDVLTAGNNSALGEEALDYCRDCVRERNLDMKLVDVLILQDRSKMIFYFTAPARIDFRELVKDLVRRYRTRIELRQIGVRHETQMVGALGNCGMVCCCRRYLRKFAPVAIKMAKEQNVFLNPVKISGICGRLLCCLAYEQEHYDEFYRSCPKLGKKYHTDVGVVRVLRASLFRESVTVLGETGEETEYSLGDWEALHPFRPNTQQQPQAPRKQQDFQGDGRQRRNDGRDRRPPSRPDRGQNGAAGSHFPVTGSEPEPSGTGDPEELLPPAATVVFAEETVISLEQGGVAAVQSRTVEAVFLRDAPGDAPGDAPDDAPGAEDMADAENEDGAEEDGGSIFGLSPKRPVASGQNGAEGSERKGGGQRRKRPRRRRPHAGSNE